VRAQPKRGVPLQCAPPPPPRTSRKCTPAAMQCSEWSGSRRTSPTAVIERRGTRDDATCALLNLCSHRAKHDALRHDSQHKYPTQSCPDLCWSTPAFGALASPPTSDRAVRLASLHRASQSVTRDAGQRERHCGLRNPQPIRKLERTLEHGDKKSAESSVPGTSVEV
jgi:hypothetical protein